MTYPAGSLLSVFNRWRSRPFAARPADLTQEQWEELGHLLCAARDLYDEAERNSAPGSPSNVTLSWLHLNRIGSALDRLRGLPCWVD